MFLIVVVSIVEGLDRYIREDLASAVFGVNTVTLRRWSDGPVFGGSGARGPATPSSDQLRRLGGREGADHHPGPGGRGERYGW